jgi:hypothetical protein
MNDCIWASHVSVFAARFATSWYQEPTDTNTSNVFMHLTNYAVNKYSRTYIVDDKAGSKRYIVIALVKGFSNLLKLSCFCIYIWSWRLIFNTVHTQNDKSI